MCVCIKCVLMVSMLNLSCVSVNYDHNANYFLWVQGCCLWSIVHGIQLSLAWYGISQLAWNWDMDHEEVSKSWYMKKSWRLGCTRMGELWGWRKSNIGFRIGSLTLVNYLTKKSTLNQMM